MIKRIYEVIADKTLSFGCKIQCWNYETLAIEECFPSTQWVEKRWFTLSSEREIIWHLVMIWDVYDYLEKQKVKWCWFEIIQLRENKRKSIDDQSEECITFIYNIIKNDNN